LKRCTSVHLPAHPGTAFERGETIAPPSVAARWLNENDYH
jgi:hypothetical protein